MFSFHTPELNVDAWNLTHGTDGSMKEDFIGKIKIENQDSLLYLGHVMPQDGTNMKNIINKRNKSLGTQKQIPKMIKNLGPYTFEAALVYIK